MASTPIQLLPVCEPLFRSTANIWFFPNPTSFWGLAEVMGGASVRGRPVQILVQGPVSIDALDNTTQQIMSQLSTIPGIRDVGESLPPQMPEIEINVDRQRCADAGISATTVGNTISTLVQGTTATQIEWQGLLTDVNVSLRDEDITNQAALMDLSIPGANGTLYPLSSLATVTAGTGPNPTFTAESTVNNYSWSQPGRENHR